MDAWLDFFLVALVLSIAWLGWALVGLSRSQRRASQPRRHPPAGL